MTNLANFPLQWTVAFPLTLLWVILKAPNFLRSYRVLAGVALGFVLALFSDDWTLAVAGAFGVGVFVHILGEAKDRRDPVGLALALWLLFPLLTAWYQHLPAKYLVPSTPAMALLVSGLPLTTLRRRRVAVTTVAVAGLILSVAIIRADAAQAEIGKRGGETVAGYLARGERVWMDGGWGFQWYAMEAGAEPLAYDGARAAPGDIVVAGLNSWVVRHFYPDKTLLSAEIFAQPGGRLFGEGAGFYASGPLPWVWGKQELGRIEVWRVEPTPRSGE